MRLHRIAAASALAVSVFWAMPAVADTPVTYMSYLRFPDAAPTDALYGPDPVLRGAVSPVRPDLVDFSGRAVIDVGRSSTLNPNAQNFAFGAVIRLTRGAGDWNIMQKGYWSDRGQWKLSLDQTPAGLRFSCRVKGTAGAVMVYSPRGLASAGGPWVRVECRRVGNVVSVLINSRAVATATGATGTVANDAAYLIGSKGMSAGEPDQFRGQIDYVWVKRW